MVIILSFLKRKMEVFLKKLSQSLTSIKLNQLEVVIIQLLLITRLLQLLQMMKMILRNIAILLMVP